MPRSGGPPYSSNAATIIAVILFSDDNPNRALTQAAVVVGGLLRVANIKVVEFERLTEAHSFEWVLFLGPDFVDHRPDSFLTRAVLGESERLKRDRTVKTDAVQHHKR